MTELVINEQMGQPDHLNGHFMKHFADSLGVSLEKLGEEYDDMIKNFELQVNLFNESEFYLHQKQS